MAVTPFKRRFRGQPTGSFRIRAEFKDKVAAYVVGNQYFDGEAFGTLPVTSNQSLVSTHMGDSVRTNADGVCPRIDLKNPAMFREFGFVFVGRWKTNTNYDYPITIENNALSNVQFIMSTGSSSQRLTNTFPSSNFFYTSSGNLADVTPATGAMTFYSSQSLGNGKTYIDGALVHSSAEGDTSSYTYDYTCDFITLGGDWDVGTRTWRGEIDAVIIIRNPTPDLMQALSADPWMVFEPPLVIVPAGSGSPSSPAVVAQPATQANVATVGSVSTETAVVAQPATQANVATVGSVSTETAVVAQPATQANVASEGTAAQGSVVTATSAIQENTATTSSVELENQVVGESASQLNVSTTGSVATSASVSADIATQSNVATSPSVALSVPLTVENANQSNVATDGSIATVALIFAENAVQTNTASDLADSLNIKFELSVFVSALDTYDVFVPAKSNSVFIST